MQHSDIPDKLLPARQVWERFNISDRTLANWLDRPKLEFPRPIIINRRKCFYLVELVEWERRFLSEPEAA